MERHFDLTDIELEKQISNCSLDSAVFSHEAHLRLAWIHIHKYGVNKAVENISFQLRQFVESLGARDKFNQTVTVAAIRAVYHFMLKAETSDFRNFMARNPRLKTHFKEILSQHYHTDIFKSELAKREYLEPELLPFD